MPQPAAIVGHGVSCAWDMKNIRFVAEVTLVESRGLAEVRCGSYCGGDTFGDPSDSWRVVREVAGGEMGNRDRASENVDMGDSSSKFQVAIQNRPVWVAGGH